MIDILFQLGIIKYIIVTICHNNKMKGRQVMKMHLLSVAKDELYTLRYLLLEDDEYYGIAIESICGNCKNSVYCYRISQTREQVVSLIQKAAHCKLFPISLPGVIEDWLWEQKHLQA